MFCLEILNIHVNCFKKIKAILVFILCTTYHVPYACIAAKYLCSITNNLHAAKIKCRCYSIYRFIDIQPRLWCLRRMGLIHSKIPISIRGITSIIIIDVPRISFALLRFSIKGLVITISGLNDRQQQAAI